MLLTLPFLPSMGIQKQTRLIIITYLTGTVYWYMDDQAGGIRNILRIFTERQTHNPVSLVMKLRNMRHGSHQWPYCLLCVWIQLTTDIVSQNEKGWDTENVLGMFWGPAPVISWFPSFVQPVNSLLPKMVWVVFLLLLNQRVMSNNNTQVAIKSGLRLASDPGNLCIVIPVKW